MKKLLTSLAVLRALASAPEASAQEIRTEGPEEVKKEIVMQQDSTSKEVADTLNLSDVAREAIKDR